jgi:RND family efflux transporter MFP subunit
MKKLLFLIIALGCAGLVGFRAYNAYKAKAAEPAAGGVRESKSSGRGGGVALIRVPLVDTAIASEGSLEDKVSLVGSLRPIAEVQVMSKIAGRVEKVLVDVGDFVQAGQLLAQVEDREIQQQIQEAEASLSVARASIRGREAELANVIRQVKRFRELHEQNLIARQDLDDLITKQQSAEAQLELGKAQASQAEANLNQFKINLDNTRSNAPMDGFVGRRNIHPGALVAINTPIVNLVDLRTLRMVINVVERDIVRVNKGVTAEVSVDAFPGRTFAGKVLRVSPVMDAATRTGEVEIHVSNPGNMLRAEMFARVTLDLGTNRRGILVPREALVYKGDQSGVFTLEGSVARFRPVEPGLTQQASVEIVQGLKVGEKVVAMGASLLKDGDQVRLKGEGPPPGRGGRSGGPGPASKM